MFIDSLKLNDLSLCLIQTVMHLLSGFVGHEKRFIPANKFVKLSVESLDVFTPGLKLLVDC